MNNFRASCGTMVFVDYMIEIQRLRNFELFQAEIIKIMEDKPEYKSPTEAILEGLKKDSLKSNKKDDSNCNKLDSNNKNLENVKIDSHKDNLELNCQGLENFRKKNRLEVMLIKIFFFFT